MYIVMYRGKALYKTRFYGEAKEYREENCPNAWIVYIIQS